MSCSSYAEVLAANTLENDNQGTTPWTALGGPSVTVNVPESGFVRVSFSFATEEGAATRPGLRRSSKLPTFPMAGPRRKLR